jgi:hypothetical protein
MVERAFRTSKSLFATRRIFHKLDETICGHVSCSFLVLVLKKELEDRIADLGQASSWPDILADLDSFTETEVEQDGTLSPALGAAHRRKSCLTRRRRRLAANCAALAPPNQWKRSAKPVPGGDNSAPSIGLQIRPVRSAKLSG